LQQSSSNAQLLYHETYQYIELNATGGNAYAGKTEITAALRINGAGLEERLAFASFESFAAGSGGSKCEKCHSEENGGFEELHSYRSEDGGVK
jgi:hypothetical protein